MRRQTIVAVKRRWSPNRAFASPELKTNGGVRIDWGRASVFCLTALSMLFSSSLLRAGQTVQAPAMVHGSPVMMHDAPCLVEEPCNTYVPCGPCLPLHFDVRAEYLAWWTKNPGLPPLVTTSPLDTDLEDSGVLGQPGTQVLFGDGSLAEDAQSGFGLRLNGWLDACRTMGFEFGYATLDDKTTDFQAIGDDTGNPILALPFVNTAGFVQDARRVSFPDLLEGSVTVNTSTRLYTFEALFRKALIATCDRRTDFLIGYRYAHLNDNLIVAQAATVLEQFGDVVPETTIDIFDQFEAENTFNGVEFGLAAEQDVGHWDVELLAKLALGNTKSRVRIDGLTTTQPPDAEADAVVEDGGLFAQPTNMGGYEQDTFGAMTELGVRLHYEFACRWRASLGYQFLYWYHVARASDHIDTTLNMPQPSDAALVGPQRPAFQWQTDGFWAQGLSFGIQYQY